MLRHLSPVLFGLAAAVLAGCGTGGAPSEDASPSPSPSAAEPGDFEDLSGAEIPESAESVEVVSSVEESGLRSYVATFTLPSEEEAADFCASGDIGNYLPFPDDVPEEERERLLIGDAELTDPRGCSSMRSGENVDRSVVFSFPEDGRVSVWAVAEEFGR
ncbi:hypothetical protein O4J56_10575 [Nocardiopsis sp. RSe5-2]|uniref:Lipoprotein n=1 Tax=Nocardiopsis endophytica TaxID=3018445 RepID=A0ABT4U2B4_9ACTN|nr:hypothetical protein [Nocardiopsis endophytica]MDA2811081.1 hypothetical protein [Nocardiopsis endophytica]